MKLLLGLGVVILAGCSHQNRGLSEFSCSDVTKKYDQTSRKCNEFPAEKPAPTAGKWNTATATNSEPQKNRSIGSMITGAIDLIRPAKPESELITTLPPETEPATPTVTGSIGSTPKRSYSDLTSIVRHTLRDNPDIGIAWAQERDEKTSIEIARAATQPTLSVRAAIGPENFDTDDDKSTGVARQEFGIDLHQVIYDFGRTQGNIARRKALHNSAGYRRIDKMNNVTLDVATAFLSTHEASQHLHIALQNVASHEEILALVSASQKAGNATVADVKRVTTRLEKAKTNLIDLRSRKQNAREDFIRLTGLEPRNLAQPPNFRAPLPPKGISSDQFPDNPELFSVRADIDSLRAQAKTAKANFSPSIDLDVTGNVKNNVQGETGRTAAMKGMLSFNYKFLDGDLRMNTLRQIYIRIEENKHRYRKKRREYIHKLESAIRTVRANLEKSSLLDTRVRDSKKVLSLYKAQFKDGSKTVFEMLDAQMDLFTTSGEKITNRYGKLRSIYEIYALRGDLVARLLR